MKAYEIRTKDLKSVVFESDSESGARACYARNLALQRDGCVLVLHEWESEAEADKARLDWLEANLLHLSHERATNSLDMGGKCVRGQLLNAARGQEAGPSYFTVLHRSIREAIDDARQSPQPKLTVIAK